jgi:glutamate/tyrosine decarboxylase-like PLP-dependent enzyme
MDDRDGARPGLAEYREALSLAADEALRFLEALPEQPVRSKGADDAAMRFGGDLPEVGDGATATIRRLLDDGIDAAVRSAGPRFFHFVIGGSTPASVAADWLASALDQNAGAWVATPLGARLEAVSLSWLKQLFGLPDSWGGVLTTGATMANLVGLACARRWWAQQHGVDVDDEGFGALPGVPVFSSGFIHPSSTKALAMLGIGRSRVQRFTADDSGRLDVDALQRALRDLGGEPSIIVANAGEVNAGHFDPISTVADLAEEHGAWLHVDGAFGLFAAVSPRTEELVNGITRAHSVIADGHKWLNVPYESGFTFVRDVALMAPVFGVAAAYLPRVDDPRPNFMNLGPESSRRARSIPVWATLHAYGRRGVREIVERNLDLAQRVARKVDEAPDLERLAEVPLNIVSFRYRPPDVSDSELDDLNRRLGEAVLEDGRVFVGTTVYRGKVAFRPAFVNWMSTADDADLLIEVVRELGATLKAG